MNNENYELNNAQEMKQFNYNGPVVIDNMASVPSRNMAISALVFGVFALLSFWLYVVPYIFGIAGFVTGIIVLAKKKPGSKLAVAGIIISLIGIIGSALMDFLIIAAAVL